MFAQIDRFDLWQLRSGITARQHEVAIAPRPRIDVRFDRRSRRGQDYRAFAEAAAHDSHVAGLVMDAVILLVALVVLLIDHDEAELAIGEEQGRARANHHAGFARRDGPPNARTLIR